jgi:hypothetical protein
MRGIVVLVLVVAVLVVAGCESEDNAAARRAEAAASAERAQAEAYQVRMAADTEAAAERAAIREASRQAGHERVIELLPFVVAILGAVAVAGIGLLVWSRPRQAPAVDPGILLLLEQQRRQLAEAERATWRIVAEAQRRQLVGEQRVSVYDDHER